MSEQVFLDGEGRISRFEKKATAEYADALKRKTVPYKVLWLAKAQAFDEIGDGPFELGAVDSPIQAILLIEGEGLFDVKCREVGAVEEGVAQ